MCIVTEKKSKSMVLRLTSELISEQESGRIIENLSNASSEGIFFFAISLESPLTSNITMMGLLVICEKIVRRFNGNLCLIIMPECKESGIRGLCETLKIPIYDNEDAWEASVAAATKPLCRREERISYQQLLSDFLNRSRELYHHLLPEEFDFTVKPAKY